MIDLAIIGAGAAGISAAREAKTRGMSAVIFEASDGIGGRAHQIAWDGHFLDLGAGWLHSANRNPLVPLAEALELVIDRSPTAWRRQYRSLGFARRDQEAAYGAFTAFEEEVAKPQLGDVAAKALSPDGRWNAFIEALSGYLNGTSLECISAEDYAAYSAASTKFNWRLEKSYGSLLAALGRGIDIRLGFAVDEIDWDGRHVALSSRSGSAVAAAAIVTVSTGVLTSGGIRFFPEPSDQLHAAAGLPLGHVEKIFFALEDAGQFPSDAHLIGNPHSSDTGSYMIAPMGIPVVEAFFGGDWVRDASVGQMEALARKELNDLLGASFDRQLRRIAHSNWKGDSHFGGSYSYARPGHHAARTTLSRKAGERLAFAGEACSPTDFSTVHGAWQSGIDAVEQLFGSNR